MAEGEGGAFSGITQGSAGSGLIGGILDSGLGFLASRRQYQRTKKMFQNRYQWTASDLQKAGLNRILALTKGPGAGSNVAQANVAGIGRGTALMAAQIAQIRASTAKTVTEEALLRKSLPTAEVQEEVMRKLYGQGRKMLEVFIDEQGSSALDVEQFKKDKDTFDRARKEKDFFLSPKAKELLKKYGEEK